jgi:hypothetical protein
MLMTKERGPAIWTTRGWAISVLQEAHAIHEGEYHGWARDRADSPATRPSRPPGRIRLQVFLRTPPRRRPVKFWTQSKTPVRSARPKAEAA